MKYRIVEKTNKNLKNNIIHKILREGEYRTDLPRIINWKGIELYDKRYNLSKTTRCNFKKFPNIREYNHNGQEGLLTGPVSSQGFSLGTVSISAMHLAGILGVKDIYLIGSELIFKDDSDHFYKSRMYRDDQKNVKSKSNRHIIIDVEKNGKSYKTTKYFMESAKYLDDVIENEFIKNGINIFDFSDGLITKAINLDIHEFLK